jgi:hypothetical protein
LAPILISFSRRLVSDHGSAVFDLVLHDAVGRQPDHVTHVFGFKELVDLRVGEGRIAAEIAPLHSAPGSGRLPAPALPASRLRVPVDRDHGFRWKMIAQSGGT